MGSLQRALELEQIQADDELIKALAVEKYFKKDKEEKEQFFDLAFDASDKEIFVRALQYIEHVKKDKETRDHFSHLEKLRDYLAKRSELTPREREQLRDAEDKLKGIIRHVDSGEYDRLWQNIAAWKQTTWTPALATLAQQVVNKLPDPLALIPGLEKLSADDQKQAKAIVARGKADLQERLANRASPADIIKHVPQVRDNIAQRCKEGVSPQAAIQEAIEPKRIVMTDVMHVAIVRDVYRQLLAIAEKAGLTLKTLPPLKLALNYVNNEAVQTIIVEYRSGMPTLGVEQAKNLISAMGLVSDVHAACTQAQGVSKTPMQLFDSPPTMIVTPFKK